MSTRCDEFQSLLTRGCTEDMIEDPHGEHKVLQNKTVTNRKKVKDRSRAKQLKPEDITQIQPQKLNLTLRSGAIISELTVLKKKTCICLCWLIDFFNIFPTGEPQSFKLKFKRAEDYPIDLYYLMDLSFSMADDLENVKNLGTSLMSEMSKITSDFRIGGDHKGPHFEAQCSLLYCRSCILKITCERLNLQSRLTGVPTLKNPSLHTLYTFYTHFHTKRSCLNFQSSNLHGKMCPVL